MNSDLIRQVTKSPNHQMLGLYIHIPFCSAICNYCNFNRGLFDADLKVRYVEALLAEIRQAGLKACTTSADAATADAGAGTGEVVAQPFRAARRRLDAGTPSNRFTRRR